MPASEHSLFPIHHPLQAVMLVATIIIIIIIVQKVHYEQQTTNCIENSTVHTSYRATVQSAEIISLISDS